MSTRMLQRLGAMSSAAVLACAARAAAACPVCATETGEQVRAVIAGPDFAHNLLVTLLPFPIFLAIAAVIHFGLPGGREGGETGRGGDRETRRRRQGTPRVNG